MIYLIVIILLLSLIFLSYIIYNKKSKKMQQLYIPLDLAKYICSLYDMNNIQLQKILLYLQIQYLKEYNCPLFVESFIKQRKYFVVNSVYLYFCGFGSTLIYYKFPDEIPLDNEIQQFICKQLDNISSFDINTYYNYLLFNTNKDNINYQDLKKLFIK